MAQPIEVSYWLYILLSILFLLLGVSIGALYYSTHVIEIEKPTIIKETEIKVIEIPTKDNRADISLSEKDRAISDFLKEVSEDDDLLTCSGEEFDSSQVTISRLENFKLIKTHRDDAGEYQVNMDLKVKYLDSYTQEKCYKNYEVSIKYDNDREEPIIEIE